MALLAAHCALSQTVRELKFVSCRDSPCSSSSYCSSIFLCSGQQAPTCLSRSVPFRSSSDEQTQQVKVSNGLNFSHGKESSRCSGLKKRGGKHLSRNTQSTSWASPSSSNFRTLQVFAKADDSMSPSEMSLENALKLLGVQEGASFNEILVAKKSLVDSYGGDPDQIAQVEAAYDTLLMQSLLQRRQGKVLDSTIRYADVRKPKAASTVLIGGPEWLRGALQRSPVAVQTPPVNSIGLQTGVYGALIIWTLTTGLSSSSSSTAMAAGADAPGFILAIGFGASLYFLRKKNLKLGKSTLITIAGLVAGAVVGGTVESWLRVDIVPLFGIGSPAVVVSEFVLISMYLTSLFLQ